MKSGEKIDMAAVPGLTWLASGESVLSGSLLRLFNRLDQLFLDWADSWSAVEYCFPALIAAEVLLKVDYLRSFPHLATFPVVLKKDPENLTCFRNRLPSAAEPSACISLTETEPVKNVLTPAACYHLYPQLENTVLGGPLYLTTRSNCFRREESYAPLSRQWSFFMREIVCLGTASEVRSFLEQMESRLSSYSQRIGLDTCWQNATDPFFQPQTNPKYIMQKVEPVKREMVFENALAIGSINFHRDFFGEAFNIRRDADEACSGCVAFGLERWIYAFITQWGLDESVWYSHLSEVLM